MKLLGPPHGLSPDATEEMYKGGSSPLQAAAHEGNARCVDILLAAGADVNREDHKERTALMVAALNGQVKCLSRLLLAGADHKMLDAGGRSARTMADANSQHELLEVLDRWDAAGAAEQEALLAKRKQRIKDTTQQSINEAELQIARERAALQRATEASLAAQLGESTMEHIDAVHNMDRVKMTGAGLGVGPSGTSHVVGTSHAAL